MFLFCSIIEWDQFITTMHAQCHRAPTTVLRIVSNSITLVLADLMHFNISFRISQLLSFEKAISWVNLNFLQITKCLAKIAVEQVSLFLIQKLVDFSENSILFHSNLSECCWSFLLLLNYRTHQYFIIGYQNGRTQYYEIAILKIFEEVLIM